MAVYTQATRPLQFTSPVFGDEPPLIIGFRGQEAVSQPFLYEVDLLSPKSDIWLPLVIGARGTIMIQLHDGQERRIHGLIRRMVQLGRRDELTSYRVELVPWLWFLSLTRDCRVFQNMSVPQIIEHIFQLDGFHTDRLDFGLQLNKDYPTREYCVQYRESTLDFVSRLMEEEGIFYFFKHLEKKHMLVLADTTLSVKPCPLIATVRALPKTAVSEDVVTDVHWEASAHAGNVLLAEYDYLQPELNLQGRCSGKGQGDIYDYRPVAYRTVEEGDRYARILLEAEEAEDMKVRCKGNCRFVQSGYRITIANHYQPDFNQAYLVLEVQQSASAQHDRSTDDPDWEYHCEFVASRVETWGTRKRTKRPTMPGPQTAVVVGPEGEEIWVDKYGRVKIQFHWDRWGMKNEKSSCWVRVASPWAGKGWGFVSLPRIGQEVIVDFLEGDPDRPIIVGRVHNATQPPPYELPAHSTQSGIKSRSSKKGGPSNFNELRFDDKLGSELVFLQAEKNMQELIKANRATSVGGSETITIGGNRTEEVHRDEQVTVNGKRNVKVHESEQFYVEGDRKQTVDGIDDVWIGKHLLIRVDGKEDVKVEEDISIHSNGSIEEKAENRISLEANTQIEIKVGGSTIKVTPSGIELSAPRIKLNGLALVELKAPLIQGKADAALDLNGAATQVKGDGVLILKGGVTMIN